VNPRANSLRASFPKYVDGQRCTITFKKCHARCCPSLVQTLRYIAKARKCERDSCGSRGYLWAQSCNASAAASTAPIRRASVVLEPARIAPSRNMLLMPRKLSLRDPKYSSAGARAGCVALGGGTTRSGGAVAPRVPASDAASASERNVLCACNLERVYPTSQGATREVPMLPIATRRWREGPHE